MAQRSATLTVAVAIVTSAMSSLGCHPGEQAQHSRMYSTISTSDGSTEPNRLVSVDRGSGAQLALGKVGATPDQFSLAWDARSGFLFGVNPFTSWGVITRIDPETGEATAVATFPQRIGAIAVSPAGQVYGISSPRTLVLVDLSKRALGVVGDIAGGDVVRLDSRAN